MKAYLDVTLHPLSSMQLTMNYSARCLNEFPHLERHHYKSLMDLYGSSNKEAQGEAGHIVHAHGAIIQQSSLPFELYLLCCLSCHLVSLAYLPKHHA